jgi:Sigma-70, region 4
MGTRWFGTLGESNHAGWRQHEAPRSGDRDAIGNSWRARADALLKKTLVGGPSGAADFTSAMARQAIDEAMHELPTQHKQVVKLAYFGGLTNREIAQELGITVGGVRRRLRVSLAVVGAQIERGRAKGRRALHDLALVVSGRQLAIGTHDGAAAQLLQAGMVAATAVAAAVLLITHPISPGPVLHPHSPPRVAAVGLAGVHLLQVKGSIHETAVAPVAHTVAVGAAAPPAPGPPSLRVKVRVPMLPRIYTPAAVSSLLSSLGRRSFRPSRLAISHLARRRPPDRSSPPRDTGLRRKQQAPGSCSSGTSRNRSNCRGPCRGSRQAGSA